VKQIEKEVKKRKIRHWGAFVIQLGLNAYIILMNLIIGLILAFSIGVIYKFKAFKNDFEKKVV